MNLALETLCGNYGIQVSYHDIWGKHCVAPESTLRALLAAMGIPATTDAEVEASLRRFENEQWRAMLPPVCVTQDDAPTLAIDINIAKTLADRAQRWRLRLESGELREGSLVPAKGEPGQTGAGAHEAMQRYRVTINQRLPMGYHDFEIPGETETHRMRVIVAPRRCYTPEAVRGEHRAWGLAAQLYGLRTQRNWGIGDFTDLRALVEFAASEGAGTVAINPLHALFPDNLAHDSPYNPSSRAFLNILYLDVEIIPEYSECDAARAAVEDPEFQAQLRALRGSDRVEYNGIAAAKRRVLELLYAQFRQIHLHNEDERARSFRAFQGVRGTALRRHALFEALQEHFRATDSSVWGWPMWPTEYRDPDSKSVVAFTSDHVDRIEFFEYLQWQAEEQLASVGKRSWELGLGIGLMQDLALAPATGGSETWSEPSLYTHGAELGAPPDDFNLFGQNWALPVPIPHVLRARGYQPFINVLRTNMKHAGALRIDHVMALQRLFWIPKGERPDAGTYVAYPRDEMLAILALESRRNWCLVIGEDLGTVPEDLRAALTSRSILLYRVLYFEKSADGAFSAPHDLPARAIVCVSTHDLPTLSGFWRGHDLDERARLGLFPDDAMRESQVIARAQDRARLLMALEREQLLPPGTGVHPVQVPELTPELTSAVHAYAARAPCALMLAQCEDLFGCLDQSNLPGTTSDQHPNWRRKLPLNLREWSHHDALLAITAGLRRERGSSVTPHLMPAPEYFPLPDLRIPRATYRFQFNRSFTFSDATALVPYLQELGVSHVYCSPYLKARPGSTHGYDIIDHSALNPEIGSNEDFDQFCAALREHGMGQILDMVPNHMGVMGSDNQWWLDVLENGPASVRAKFFDIDWYPLKEELRGKVLIPVLGAQYGVVLERGELKLVFDRERGEFSVFYYEHRFPIDPQQYPRILALGIDRLQARLGASHPDLLEFESRITAFRNLPQRSAHTAEEMGERHRDKELHKQHLATLCGRSPDITHYVEENVATLNGDPTNPISFGALHELLEAQAFRLAYWRVAADEINYRRFFDINDLAALRMENIDVFQATHRLVLELLRTGKIDGLRIDHPDGLYDPLQYFTRLQRAVSTGASDQEHERHFYLVVEKILAPFERLPESWPVHGTTGYEFANACLGLLLDGDRAEALSRTYHEFTGDAQPFDDVLYRAKQQTMVIALAGELNVLASELSRIAEADRATCDFTLNGLRRALQDVVACFPVYRTYVDDSSPSQDDMRYIDWAVAAARKRSRLADLSIFDFIRDVLLKSRAEGKSDAFRNVVTAFAMKVQQYTSPVMAKSMEDTAFYSYNRLTALNEVGGDPRRFGVSVAQFHHMNLDRARVWPHAMLSTSTHDSKRSEDVRARLAVLSELTDEWNAALLRWSRINRSKKADVDNAPAPTANDEYLLYQILLGAWPWDLTDDSTRADLIARIEQYMVKAVREGKVNSSWLNPNVGYEEGLTHFVRALLDPERGKLFLSDFSSMQKRVAQLGVYNSISQLILKLTAPGMPDLYQGNEIWDYSLVDPDNRRPVDYAMRRSLLDSLKECDPRKLLAHPEDGRIKLFVTTRLLQLRAQREDLLKNGEYFPMGVSGPKSQHLCAYARKLGDAVMIVVCPRLFATLVPDIDHPIPAGQSWQGTELETMPFSGQRFQNCLTGQTVESMALPHMLNDFPWAVLVTADNTG